MGVLRRHAAHRNGQIGDATSATHAGVYGLHSQREEAPC